MHVIPLTYVIIVNRIWLLGDKSLEYGNIPLWLWGIPSWVLGRFTLVVGKTHFGCWDTDKNGIWVGGQTTLGMGKKSHRPTRPTTTPHTDRLLRMVTSKRKTPLSKSRNGPPAKSKTKSSSKPAKRKKVVCSGWTDRGRPCLPASRPDGALISI